MSVAFFENNKKSIFLIGLYLLMIILISFYWPQQIDWTPSFSKDDSKPYGAKVLYETLPELFSDLDIEVAERPIYNIVNDSINYQNGKAVYFIFNDNFIPDSLDLDRLLTFVELGNTAFISAERIADKLLDTLGIREVLDYEIIFQKPKPLTVGFYDDMFTGDNPRYKDMQSLRHFGCTDSLDTKYATSWITRDSIDFYKLGLRFNYGKGKILLNRIPTAYTNVHILDTINYKFTERTIAFLDDYDYLIWDEYYKVGKRVGHGSPLREILLVPAFKWAYWISLISILFFIIFHAKRKQRIIPIIEPYKNNNKEYVETIGSLYYNTSSYKEMIHKKVLFFREYIYKKYKISDLEFTEEFVERLSEKTILDKEEISELFRTINQTLTKEKITAEHLRTLTQKINNFYNKA